MEYIGFADAIEFVKISGISKNDLEKHVYSNKEFQEKCMYRFGKNHKRYIKIRPAIDFIEQNLMVSETALQRRFTEERGYIEKLLEMKEEYDK